MFSSKDLFFTPTSGGYTVSKSLRFRSSASAYLSRTFGTPTTQNVFTFSTWMKRGKISTQTCVFGESASSSNGLYFDAADTLSLYFASSIVLTTTAVFRDPSAWYHIVWTSNGSTQTIYVNNVSRASGTASQTRINSAIATYIMSQTTGSIPTDGYLAEVNFIDGQALTPSSFGAYDTNGVWQPTAYSGTGYGNNGFYLKFTDNSGATSTTIGKDSSGNSNNWTPNNISVTSGTTYDSMLDSPTNAAGDIGNYAVINPIDVSPSTVANGNLTISYATNADTNRAATFGVNSGKWYWETTITAVGGTYSIVGITSGASTATALGTSSYQYSYISSTGNKFNNGSAVAYGATYTTGDVIGIALDMDAGTLVFYKNNTSQGTAYTGLSGTFFPAFNARNSSSNDANFGQRPFAYTPPSGYSPLCTQNLTTPTITNGASYMAAVLYTGTGSSQTITASSTNSGNNPNGTTFQPDLVWVKGRSGATDHAWYDAVRGVQLQLESNTTTAETTETTGLTAFTSSGFTTGALAQMNTNTATYVAWEWNAGGSNATNTSGSITSTVRANTSAGFSVVTYTGTLANATVGHGLGAAPNMIIVKQRSGSANNWPVYHAYQNASPASGNVFLNLTDAFATDTTRWNNTAPTSTVFSLGNNAGTNNTGPYVAYCFAPVAGYSAFGSYTANASTDGPMVFLNLRPRYVLLKNTTRAADWIAYDSSRDLYNTETQQLYPNLSSAEASGANIDFLSNGFKIRAGSGSGINNTSGDVYIYAAFAENPFKISRAR